MKKPHKFDKKVWVKWKPIVSTMATQIESTLDSFGIKGKIMAITLNDDHILLELSMAPGVRVEDVERLNRTLALAIAAPTGKIKMSQIPGTSHIGIVVKGIKLGS